MILYIHAEGETKTEVKCESISEPENAAACKAATDVTKDKECQFVAAKEGVEGSKNSCKLVTKATSSSEILNIFKITFALLIIFTIL
jgi:hypothetical protein